jgi:glycosyltransferase involved in cell wall biosynthesis
MKVWIVKTGEPLPVDGSDVRLLRSGSFANYLVEMGHNVVWWTGAFDHALKRKRCHAGSVIQIAANYRLWLIDSPGYERNISLERMRDHKIVAERFTALAELEGKPDVIHCAYPTIDLSLASVNYGKRHSVPVILDVRDMWPDLFLDVFPSPLKGLARLLLSKIFKQSRMALAGAKAISGHSPGFVEYGLRIAQRNAGELDRWFPFTYDSNFEGSLKGIDLGAVSIPKELEDHDSWFNICFLGNLSGEGLHNDFETPIKAVTYLAARGRKIRLLLCGTGKGADKLRKRFSGSKCIKMLGWVDRATLWRVMNISQLGLIPYKPNKDFIISLPNKSIEYLAGGLPVLTSLNRGYLFELFNAEDCGVFFESGDVRGLARMLDELIDCPDRVHAMAQKSKALFALKFSRERIYAAMEKQLRDVIGLCS